MDIGSIFGIGLGSAMVLLGMALGGSFVVYIDFPSFLIVVMGTTGIVIGSLPQRNLANGVKAALKAFVYTARLQTELILQLVDFAVRARRDGILSLESAEEEMNDEFLRKGVRLAVDGTEPTVIQTILETDLEYMAKRHESGLDMLNIFATIAPAMGMIGTFIGLIAMLQNMDDPSAIGPAMAVALLTSLYGALISNLIATPMANRLKIRSAAEQNSREIMIAGIMAIQSGDNPRIVEQKLNAYLPPATRQTQFD